MTPTAGMSCMAFLLPVQRISQPLRTFTSAIKLAFAGVSAFPTMSNVNRNNRLSRQSEHFVLPPTMRRSLAQLVAHNAIKTAIHGAFCWLLRLRKNLYSCCADTRFFGAL